MARDTVDSRMGANLKSSKGVAVGPDAISREPAAWARGATTAALFFRRFFFSISGGQGGSEVSLFSFDSNSDDEGSSGQRTHGAREAKLRETKKKKNKKETRLGRG